MIQILKRLEIIKSSIAIEDADTVGLQLMKLYSIDIDEEANEIVKSLEKGGYTAALAMIKKYLSGQVSLKFKDTE